MRHHPRQLIEALATYGKPKAIATALRIDDERNVRKLLRKHRIARVETAPGVVVVVRGAANAN